MPAVAPCKACLPVDCSGFGGEADLYSIYSLEQPPYSYVLNCPPGYDCQNAPFLLMNCCGQTIFQNLIGITGQQRQQLVTAAINRCVQAWQFCGDLGVILPPGHGGNNGGPGGGTPPVLNLYYSGRVCCPITCFGGAAANYCLTGGTVLGLNNFVQAQNQASILACARGNAGRVIIGNNRKCYTATCPPGNPTPPVQRCVEAGTMGECLFFPSPAEQAAAQQFYDDAAQTQAQDGAQAAQSCLVCNDDTPGTLFCASNPGLNVHAVIPAGRFCVPAGGSKLNVNAQASAALYNVLIPQLQAMGCACMVDAVDVTTGTAHTSCLLQFELVYGFPGVFQGFFNFNGTVPNVCSPALHGNVVRWIPFSFSGPEIQFFC